MESLQQAVQQVTDLFRSMTPAARLTTGLLLAVVVASLFFLFQQGTERADEYLFGGEVLSQSRIAAIEAAFSKAKLNNWEATGNRIRVPRAQRAEYLFAISEENAFPETTGSAWQAMFQNDNPLKSRQIRDLEARRALEKDLAVTIQDVSGIDAASVQIEEIDSGEFPRRLEKRALVSVKANGNDRLDARRVEAIRNMVAFGGGVKAENVTVADLNSGQAYPGAGRDGAPADNLYAKQVQVFEEDLKAKIVDRLAMYPDTKVAVHVELDQEMVNQTVSNKYDPKSTPIELTDYSKETTATRPETGGRPGVVPNAAISNVPQQVSNAAGNENTSTERRENQKSLAGSTQTVTQKAPFVPTWMSVSIAVPRSYFERVWRQRNPTPAGQEPQAPNPNDVKTIETEIITDIEEAVNVLLPKVAKGEEGYPRVKVVPYTETPLPAPERPSLGETAGSWLATHWQTLGMFALAVSGVLVLRGMLRSVQPEMPKAVETIAAQRPPEPLADKAEEPKDEEDNSLRAKFQASGRSLREELAELVREDPDAAASVLQNWIGDAA